MTHWTTEFYRRVDANDPAMAALLSPTIRSQVGNHPVTYGLENLFQGPLGRHALAVNGSTHAFLNIWDADADTAVLESVVTYHRRDGKDVVVPATTILHKDLDGLIDDLRLYMDTTPLFEGWEEYNLSP